MTQPMIPDDVRTTIEAALLPREYQAQHSLESPNPNQRHDGEREMARLKAVRAWLTQQAAQPPRVQPDAHLTAWCEDALAVIARGVELMPLEQLGQWTGVRHVQEMYEAAQRGDYLSQPAPAQESSDELAQHWPQMPNLDGVDLFSEYPITGGSQDDTGDS